MGSPPTFAFEDASIGDTYVLSRTVTEADLDAFVALTGDHSPLHVDATYAMAHGFAGRVVHGAFQAGMISQLVGTKFPAASCLLHGMDLQFPAPAYIGDELQAEVAVKQLSEATRTAILRARIRRASDGKTTTRGKVMVGFLQRADTAGSAQP